MNIPARLVKFWYPEAVKTFLTSIKNLLSLLEEDLAVTLMLKLLLVPLFHDKSFVGKLISFFFRLTRVFTGLLAMALVTTLLAILAFSWLVAPFIFFILLFLPQLGVLGQILVWYFGLINLIGLGLFVHYLLQKTHLKLWQVKDVKDLWQATSVKQSEVNLPKLLQTPSVLDLMFNLELKGEKFLNLPAVELTDQTLQQVLRLGKVSQAEVITPAHFFVALLAQVPGIEQTLMQFSLNLKDFEQALTYQQLKSNKWRRYLIWEEEFATRHLKGVNRGWLSAPTPTLDSISSDLTKLAAKENLEQFIGRETILTQVVNILSQASDRNVLLVGQPGSGRSTLVKHLAKLIIAGDAPQALATKRLVELDLTKLMSGVTSEGMLAEKVKGAFEEVEFIEDVIIYVDELQNLGLGEAATNFNLYSLMLPYLESNKFQFLASTDSLNFAKIIEKNGSFARLFHKVELPPASVEETLLIIEEKAVEIARYKKINLTFLAIKQLVFYSNQLIHDRVLPDSALMILSECLPLSKNGVLDSTTVKQALQTRVKVPILEVDQSQKDLLLNLEQVIHSKMIDQEQAVKAVADTLRRASTALREQNRPIGSFLFVGPTGVGKTELAKTLASVYFKSADAFVQFDMSEYQNPDSVGRLIGDANNPGELTEVIKHKPYCLLLLDEFEKANPQILTLFLQVLEEGRLTNVAGQQVDFSNTIIIATSNAGSLLIAQGLGAGKTIEQVTPEVKNELLKVYKPELVNRFDQVVIFKPLSAPELQQITQMKLVALQIQLKEQGYLVEFSPEVVAELAKKGYDPTLGARPMRRLIQDSLEANLSKLILSGRLIKGKKLVVGKDFFN